MQVKRNSIDPIYTSLLKSFEYPVGKITVSIDGVDLIGDASDKKHLVQVNFRGVTLRSPVAVGAAGHKDHMFEYDLSLHSRMFDVIKVDIFIVRPGPRTNEFAGRARVHLHTLALKDSETFEGTFELGHRGGTSKNKNIKSFGRIHVSLQARTKVDPGATVMQTPDIAVKESIKQTINTNEIEFAHLLNAHAPPKELSDYDSDSSSVRPSETASDTLAASDSGRESPVITPPSDKKFLFFDKQTSSTLDKIAQLYAVFFRTSLPMSKTKFIRCMMMVSKVHEALPVERTNEIVRDKRRLKTAGFFFAYSQACYGSAMLNAMNHGRGIVDMVTVKTDFKSACRYLGLAKNDVFIWDFSNSTFYPNVFAAYDRRINAIVVAVRGSWSIQDVITDLVCEYVPFSNGWVHGGIMFTVEKLIERHFKDIVAKVREVKPSAIYLTGHSLGAAVSTLTCMLFNQNLDMFKRVTGRPDFRIHCYAFSPPPVASASLCEQSTDIIDAFINENELVSRLSYSSGIDFKKLIVATSEILDKPSLTKQQRLLLIAEKRKQIISDSDSQKHRIYIPGTIYLTYKTNRVRDVVPTAAQLDEMRQQEVPEAVESVKPVRADGAWTKFKCLFKGRAKAAQKAAATRELGFADSLQEAALCDFEKAFHAPLFPCDMPEKHHYLMERSRKEFFTDIRFRGNMITDHFPNRIEAAIKNVFTWLNFQSQIYPTLAQRLPVKSLTPRPSSVSSFHDIPSAIQDEQDAIPIHPPHNCKDMFDTDAPDSESVTDSAASRSRTTTQESPSLSGLHGSFSAVSDDSSLPNVPFLWKVTE